MLKTCLQDVLKTSWRLENVCWDSHKLLDHAKLTATDVFETALKRTIQRLAEATGDLISNKLANKITVVSKNSQQKNSKTVKNKRDR